MANPEYENPALWQVLQTEDGEVYYYNASLDLTQEDQPDCLRGGAEADSAAQQWVWFPSEHEGYVPAKVIERDGAGKIVAVETESGEAIRLPRLFKGETPPLLRGSLSKVRNDLVEMGQIDEGSILHNLKKRFIEDAIYTNIGTILVVVNPYRWMELYTTEIMEKVRNRGTRVVKPHIFNIADDAFKALSERMASGENPNQSILISGESGAGKTEATKQALKFLAYSAGSHSGIEQKLLDANPLLEAFGNAATLRNHNSSRFGKWMEVFFDSRRQIAGARINNYLLEKSRVSHQIDGERNFHIFYHLTSNAAMRQAYSLGTGADYAFTRKRVRIDDAHFSDEKDFAGVLKAMATFGLAQAGEQDALFQIAAAILHFGNIEFRPAPDGSGSSVVANPAELGHAAQLLGVPAEALERAVLFRTMVVKKQENVIIPLSAPQASDNRNALARTLYNIMFDWLVRRVNKAMEPPVSAGSLVKIGILDIFGFEIFKRNSFEQLCINYTNEKLQQHFNAHTFKLEQQLYMDEGIAFTEVAFIDNQPCLDLLEAKPLGILCILDDELAAPAASDARFLEKITTAHAKKHERFSVAFKTAGAFNVLHYAGEVTYDVTGFLEKNKDTIEEDLLALVNTTANGFLRELFATVAADARTRKQSIAAAFRIQLRDLMTELHATSPHYVRCIKPNSQFRPRTWEGRDCLLQLRYSGIFEAVMIRQTGYPFRYRHAEFAQRYGVFNRFVRGSSDVATCRAILAAVKADTSEIQIGRTRVLYRAKSHRRLEVLLSVAAHKAAVKAQAAFRGLRARKLYRKMRVVYDSLRRAMAARALAPLEDAIAEARSMWFRLRLTTEAEALCAVLREEARMAALLESLLSADPDRQYDAIIEALEKAEAMGLAVPAMAALRFNIRDIHERKQAVRNLRRGTELYSRKLLEEGLREVARLGLDEPEAVAAANKALERVRAEEAMVNRLAAALASPQDDFRSLQAALAELASADAKSEGAVALRARLEVTLAIRVAIRDQDWTALQAAVDSASGLALDAADVRRAVEGLRLRAQMAAAATGLQKAMAARLLAPLETALSAAIELGLESSLYSSWQGLAVEARAQAVTHRALLAALSEHTARGTASAVLPLQAAVAAAADFALADPADLALLALARAVLAVRQTLAARDWSALEAAVSAATAAGIAHSEVADARAGLELRAAMSTVADGIGRECAARAAPALSALLDEAERLAMRESSWSSWAPLVEAAIAQLAEHRRILRTLALCIGPGSEAQIDSLELALYEARKFGFRQTDDLAAIERGTLLLDLRRAMAARDWAALQTGVDSAAKRGIVSDEVSAIRAGLLLRGKMVVVATALETSSRAHDSDALAAAAEDAERLGMGDSIWSSWIELTSRALAQLRKHLDLLAALKATLGPGTDRLVGQLQQVLTNVADYGFKVAADRALEAEGIVTLRMRKALAGRDWDELAGAVAAGQALPMHSSELSRAVEGLELRSRMQAVATRLERGLSRHDSVELQAALLSADELAMSESFWSSWAELVAKAEALLARHRRLVGALVECTAPGTALWIAQLQDAIDAATEYGLKTDADRALLLAAGLTHELRAGIAAADFAAVTATVATAAAKGVSSAEIHAAADGLALRGRMAAIAERLRGATESRDSIALESALRDAAETRMATSPWSSWAEAVRAAEELLSAHRRVIRSLEGCLGIGRDDIIEPLAVALAESVDFGLRTAPDLALQSTAKTMLQIRRALAAEDWAVVKQQVGRARQAGLVSEELTAAQTLLDAREKMAALAKDLREATELADGPKLRALLARARELEMGTARHSSWQDVAAAAAARLRAHTIASLALESAAEPSAAEQTAPLMAALQSAIDIGLTTAADKALEQRGTILLRLRSALAAQDYLAAKAALESAAVARLDTAETREARDGLAVRTRMAAVAEDIKRAQRARSAPGLAAALAAADALHMRDSRWSSWDEALLAAHAELRAHRELLASLEECIESPSFPLARHESLLAAAEEMRLQQEADTDLVRKARVVLSVRQALARADWPRLESDLKTALAVGLDTEELQLAAARLRLNRQRAEAAALLKAAVGDVYNYERDGLANAIAAAIPLNLEQDPEFSTLLAQAQRLQADIIAVRGLLERGRADVDADLLTLGLGRAEQIGYETVEVASARVLHHEICAIRDGAVDALAARDVRLCKQLQRRAAMINLTGAPMPEIEAKLPLLAFEPGALALSAYPQLKPRSEYSPKPAVQATMLARSTDKLPTALRRLASADDQTQALELFLNLQIFMGDRKAGMFAGKKRGDEAFLRPLLAAGRAHYGGPLADELYLQLMKQLSENFDESSSTLGWRVMGQYVAAFVPSLEFAPFVEWWTVSQPLSPTRPAPHSFVRQMRATREALVADAARAEPQAGAAAK